MILDALSTLLRQRLYSLAAPTEKMGRVRASAQDCFLFSFPGFAVGDHISTSRRTEAITIGEQSLVKVPLFSYSHIIGSWGVLPQRDRQIR